eukprot:4342528-Prymnesium_polylepis.1
MRVMTNVRACRSRVIRQLAGANRAALRVAAADRAARLAAAHLPLEADRAASKRLRPPPERARGLARRLPLRRPAAADVCVHCGAGGAALRREPAGAAAGGGRGARPQRVVVGGRGLLRLAGSRLQRARPRAEAGRLSDGAARHAADAAGRAGLAQADRRESEPDA